MNAVTTTAPLATGTTGTTLEPTKKSEEQKTQFLKLLVAQLKGQNPLDPKDGTEFVSQLAQFSSLEELINIRTTLENFSKTVPTTGTNPFQGVKE